jgi:uncharacterized protein
MLVSAPAIPINEAQLEGLRALCRRYNVRHLWLFGSAADGTFDAASSDIDFTVEFGECPADMSDLRQFFGFQEDAASLLGRNVDLVERSAIRNKYFRQSVEQQEVLLYVA